MDDLHPDSDDAQAVTLPDDNSADTNEPLAENKGPTDEEADKDDAAPQNTTANKEGDTISDNEAPTAAAPTETTPTEHAPAATVPVVSDDGGTTNEETTDEVPTLELEAVRVERKSEYSRIREVGRDAWGRILLAWRSSSDADDDQEPPVVLLERTALDVEAAKRIIDLHLYHARLLAPRAVVTREGGVYWLVVEAPASYDAPFEAVSDGGHLEPRNTLKAGVGLANALSYLHNNGFAHGNIGPSSILVHDGRAYLSGIEQVESVDTSEPSGGDKFAADVNALAQALAPLAGLSETPADDEVAPAQALREIRSKGAAGTFVTSEDVAQECGQALQEPALTLPAADETVIRPLVFNCGTATTVGLLRSQNQDSLGCTVLDIRDDVGRDQPLGIFIVADGMGGEAAGEIASRIGARIATAELVRQLLVPTVAMPALEPFAPEYTTGATTVATLAQALAIAVDAANRQVRALAAALQESTGTTLTAVVAAGGRAVLAHLGDSRAYLLRSDTLVQLTKDHSLLARLTELDHPLLNDPSFGMPRNYLYRSLGQEDESPPDMMEFPLAPGDRMLLCSDGLWDELDDATLRRALTSTDDPVECANHLVRLANAAGGHDNSTAIVVFIEARPDDPASEIPPDQADAILRATGAFDDGEDGGTDDAALVDDAFDMGMD